jgi:ankyrin repeat protein
MKKIVLCLMFFCLCFSGCAANFKSNYPLHYAAREGDLPKAQELVKAGLPLDGRDNSGYTPLLWALFSAHDPMAEYLIAHGANVNAADKEGNTGLFFTANSCSGKMMKFLADHKANVNIKNLYGDTLLHYLASSCSSYDMAVIMEYLLEKGCDLNAVNKRGKTVYAVAIEYKNMGMVAALRRKGVMERFQDPAGGMHGALRRPSFYTPSVYFYAVPADRQIYFELAIEDCNHFTVPYKSWMFGPIVYGLQLAADQDRGMDDFDKCMKIMGFEKK